MFSGAQQRSFVLLAALVSLYQRTDLIIPGCWTGAVAAGFIISGILRADLRFSNKATLVYFRQRLIEHAEADVAMRAVLAVLQKEGLLPKRSKQPSDSTGVLTAVARMAEKTHAKARAKDDRRRISRKDAKTQKGMDD